MTAKPINPKSLLLIVYLVLLLKWGRGGSLGRRKVSLSPWLAMENAPVMITLGPEPIPEIPPAASGSWGAQICFMGRVRDTEEGRPLRGITYSAYGPMALLEMERLAANLQSEFGAHPLRLHHRTGFVANGEASLLIVVGGRHSAETFALCAEYVRRLKVSVPVWKHPEFLPSAP